MPHLLDLRYFNKKKRLLNKKDRKWIAKPLTKKQRQKQTKENRTKNLKDHIIKKVVFSFHSKEKIAERMQCDRSLEDIKRWIARRRDTSVLDEKTWNIRISYKWRWVIARSHTVLTYMLPVNMTDKSTLSNHKKLHSYSCMDLYDCEKFWRV